MYECLSARILSLTNFEANLILHFLNPAMLRIGVTSRDIAYPVANYLLEAIYL